MKDRQENKLSMYLAVKNVLDSNQKAWSSMTALKRAITQFNDKLLTINILRAEQEASIKGAAMSKFDRRENLTKIVLSVIGKAKAYATETKNQDLAAAVKLVKSDLERKRDTTFFNTCQMIYEKILPFVNDMGEYQLTTDELNKLKTATNGYGEVLQKPREAISKRKTTGETLDSVMSEIDKLLKDQIDPLVKTFEETNKDAVHTYKNARIIVDIGKRKKGEEEEPAEVK